MKTNVNMRPSQVCREMRTTVTLLLKCGLTSKGTSLYLDPSELRCVHTWVILSGCPGWTTRLLDLDGLGRIQRAPDRSPSRGGRTRQ